MFERFPDARVGVPEIGVFPDNGDGYGFPILLDLVHPFDQFPPPGFVIVLFQLESLGKIVGYIFFLKYQRDMVYVISIIRAHNRTCRDIAE